MEAYQQYFDVFGASANRGLYELALAKHGQFGRSKTSPSKYYPDLAQVDCDLSRSFCRCDREARTGGPRAAARSSQGPRTAAFRH